MDIEKKRKRVLWISKYSGGSVAVIGVLCLLCAFLPFDVVGLLIGLALTACAYMELSGRRRLKQKRPEAGRWLAASQLSIMAAIILYSAYNLLLVNPVREIKNDISGLPPESRAQLSEALDSPQVKEWLHIGFPAFYLALIAVTVLCQGGLWLYYTRATRKIEQAESAEPRGKMKT